MSRLSIPVFALLAARAGGRCSESSGPRTGRAPRHSTILAARPALQRRHRPARPGDQHVRPPVPDAGEQRGCGRAQHRSAASILIPRYGLTGAACSTTASITLVNLVKLAQVRALFGINPFRAETVRAIVAGLAATALDGAARAARRLAGAGGAGAGDRGPAPAALRRALLVVGRRGRGARAAAAAGPAGGRREVIVLLAAAALGLAQHAVRTDHTWTCKQKVDLDLVQVTIARGQREDAVHLRPGCTGRIGKLVVVHAPATGSRWPRASTTWSSAAAASAVSPRRRTSTRMGSRCSAARASPSAS